MNNYLSESQLREVYKDIRNLPVYQKHSLLYKQNLSQFKYIEAKKHAEIMKAIETQAFAQIEKKYIDVNMEADMAIESMSYEDVQTMNILSNAMCMLSDVLNNFVINTNAIFQKYNMDKCTRYENLKNLLKETNMLVSKFDNQMNDEKASFLFGQMSDNLYEMVYNKASSYVNKLRSYEKNNNKETS